MLSIAIYTMMVFRYLQVSQSIEFGAVCVIVLGIFRAKETAINSGRLGLWLVCAFTVSLIRETISFRGEFIPSPLICTCLRDNERNSFFRTSQ